MTKAARNAKNLAVAVAVAVPAFALEICFLRYFKDADGSNRPADVLAVFWRKFCLWGSKHPVGMVNLIFFVNVDILFWLISLAQSSTWLIDPYWTFIPPLIAHFYQAHPAASADPVRSWVVLALVYAWSLRLTHSYFRREKWQWGEREDWRFADMRRKFGGHWWWLSFFITFISQHVMLVGITLPLYAVHNSNRPWMPLSDTVATIVCLIAIAISYLADTSLHDFVTDNEQRRKEGLPVVLVLHTGLWKYSRHPNYFGEQLWWWGLCLFAWNVSQGWVSLGALINSICMAQVTLLVEERMLRSPLRRAQYREYQRSTSVWIPWFPASRK